MAFELSEREHSLICRVCDNHALWAPRESAPPRPRSVLTSGQSNIAVLLEGRSGHWVLRIGKQPSPPGVCRRREAVAHTAAAARGLAPELLYAEPELGLLLMAYLPGLRPLVSIDEVAALLRSIHALPCEERVDDTLDLLQRYTAGLATQSALGTLLERHATTIALAREVVLAHRSADPVLCHRDLLAANRGWHAGRAVALDWEYAAPGDPLFDLAVCAAELDDADSKRLLQRYFGRSPTRDELREYAAQRLIYQCLDACWYASHGRNPAQLRGSCRRLALLLQGTDLL